MKADMKAARLRQRIERTISKCPNKSGVLNVLRWSMDVTSEEIAEMDKQNVAHYEEMMKEPVVEMVFEDLPDLSKLLAAQEARGESIAISPPPRGNQTLYSEKISIRINQEVLDTMKKMADACGMKYQTYINQLLAHFAAGHVAF